MGCIAEETSFHSSKLSHAIAPVGLNTTRSPNNAGPLLVKRIVALEGDVIQTMPPYPDKEVTIPTGHVWVEGAHKCYHAYI